MSSISYDQPIIRVIISVSIGICLLMALLPQLDLDQDQLPESLLADGNLLIPTLLVMIGQMIVLLGLHSAGIIRPRLFATQPVPPPELG